MATEKVPKKPKKNRHRPTILTVFTLCAVGPGHLGAQQLPDLPFPVTNNATAVDTTGERPAFYSFLGVDHTKIWSGITSRAFRLTLGDTVWTELPQVDSRGRIAATAQAVDGRVFVFGGYTVDQDGSEKSLGNVDIYDPNTKVWSRGQPIPTPVDDAVSGVWNDSLIYLISGWHDMGNVQLVQVYDPFSGSWRQGTPIPGPGLFGHTGGIAGNTIIFVDGVRTSNSRPRYTIERRSWRGDINPDDPTSISWIEIEQHPGPPVYRGAGGACSGAVIIAGGTDNPYNYNGIGYDGVPSMPSHTVFSYSVITDQWVRLPDLSNPSMDHRSLQMVGANGFLIGGMRQSQAVIAHATSLRADGALDICQ